MTTQSQQQVKDDEISLIDILLFLKASGRNVFISKIGCLLIGVVYYFAVPKMYEATATIQMATVAGEMVETPAILVEKIKLPLFSPLRLCRHVVQTVISARTPSLQTNSNPPSTSPPRLFL